MLLTLVSTDVGLDLVGSPRIAIGPTTLELALVDRKNGGKPLTDLRRTPELQVVVYLVRSDLQHFGRFEAIPVQAHEGHFTIAPTSRDQCSLKRPIVSDTPFAHRDASSASTTFGTCCHGRRRRRTAHTIAASTRKMTSSKTTTARS